MLTDWINVTRVRIQEADRLYPGDIDWFLAPGINAVIGGTGLGKTTLVYALQFAIFGKLIIDSDERIEREFFRDRLTKRSGKKLEQRPPIVCVEFSIGSTKFAVKRNLLSGSLMEATCEGAPLQPVKYEEMLAEKVGLKGDFASLGRLQSHLFFFGENRYLLAWENLIQHELVNLMMSDHATYLRLGELWAEAESADSAARNISAQAVRMEKDLKELVGRESKVDALQQRSDAAQLRRLRAEREAALTAVRKRIAEERKLEATQTDKIAKSHTEFHRDLAAMETAQNVDLDDALLAAALASPTVASVRQALAEFYGAPDDRSCPCCGRVGIAAVVSRFAETSAASARAGNCVVCSKELPRSSAGAGPGPSLNRSANTTAQTLQTLLFQREQTKSRLAELLQEEARTLQALAESRDAELKHAQENPTSVAETLRFTIDQMRKREAVAKKEREKQLASLKRELAKTNAVFNDIQARIAKAFKKYATLYLDEKCDVAFLQESELPGKRGPQIKAPHAAFYPVVSGETRPSAQALSDAQRSFVDLAFRMAVLDVWHQVTKQTVTMIIETPEGAVDIAYMERVATMIRTFGEQGHTLLITTNLNNEVFLPELMAAWPKRTRRSHILNLLEVGSPRPVQIAYQPHFNAILKLVESHDGPK